MMLYQISDAATEDLNNIVIYSLDRHGEIQTQKYLQHLEKGIEALALGEGFYKTLDNIHPDLHSKHCEHHYIFGLMRTNAPMLVIAIFHERMNLLRQLEKRLK